MDLRRALALAAVTSSLLTFSACGGDDLPPKKDWKFDANGTVVMPVEEGDPSNAEEVCSEQMASLVSRQVPIKNAKGEPIGFGALDSYPSVDADNGTCVLAWVAKDLPWTDGVLSYQIGDYKPILFNRDHSQDLTLTLN